jgi:hypothetical protein
MSYQSNFPFGYRRAYPAKEASSSPNSTWSGAIPTMSSTGGQQSRPPQYAPAPTRLSIQDPKTEAFSNHISKDSWSDWSPRGLQTEHPQRSQENHALNSAGNMGVLHSGVSRNIWSPKMSSPTQSVERGQKNRVLSTSRDFGMLTPIAPGSGWDASSSTLNQFSESLLQGQKKEQNFNRWGSNVVDRGLDKPHTTQSANLSSQDRKKNKKKQALNSSPASCIPPPEYTEPASQGQRKSRRKRKSRTARRRRSSASLKREKGHRQSQPQQSHERSLEEQLDHIAFVLNRELTRMGENNRLKKYQQHVFKSIFRQLGGATILLERLTSPLTDEQNRLVERVRWLMEQTSEMLQQLRNQGLWE